MFGAMEYIHKFLAFVFVLVFLEFVLLPLLMNIYTCARPAEYTCRQNIHFVLFFLFFIFGCVSQTKYTCLYHDIPCFSAAICERASFASI